MVKVEGIPEIQRAFAELGHDLRASEMVSILRPAGRAVVKAARNYVPQKGEIKRAIKKDIGIVSGKVVKGQAVVDVGLRFKFYDINDQVQKVAPIARHMTEGFNQTNRASDNRKRGKVKVRTGDFIEQGFNASGAEQLRLVNIGIDKKIQKVKTKHGL